MFAVATLLAFTPACQEDAASSDNAVASAPVSSPSVSVAEDGPDRSPDAPSLPKYQAEAESLEATTVEFTGEVYDFGEVPEGTKVTHQFKFTNTGSNPLKLTRVKASCGCTTPKYSEESVAPGEQGYIDVEFDSSGKPGFQNKSVTVTGNFADGVNKILRIKGQVKPSGE